jgi:NDP-sugar pyrophosphorylase family protein
VRYAAQGVQDTLVVFNGDVLTGVDLRSLIALHRDRSALATIVLTPVDNPTAYGLVETDADSNVLRFLEKPEPDQITCNTINAGIYVLEPATFERIPKDVAWSIERSFFPSFIERGETFLASIYRDYWIDIGTPEKYMQVHRDIMDARYSMPPFGGEPGMVWVSPNARVDSTVRLEGPLFIDEGCVVKAGSRIGPYTVLGRGAQVDEDANVAGAIVWPEAHIGREAQVTDTIIGRSGTIGRNAQIRGGVLGDGTSIAEYSRL